MAGKSNTNEFSSVSNIFVSLSGSNLSTFPYCDILKCLELSDCVKDSISFVEKSIDKVSDEPIAVVNALSKWLELEINRDGKIYHITFENGLVKESLKSIGTSKKINDEFYTGTKITFLPSDKTFTNIDFMFLFLREFKVVGHKSDSIHTTIEGFQKFKNLSTNLDWMVLGGDTTVNEFYFVYGTNENQKTDSYLIEPAIPFQEMKAYEVSSKKADFKEHFITIEKLLEN